MGLAVRSEAHDDFVRSFSVIFSVVAVKLGVTCRREVTMKSNLALALVAVTRSSRFCSSGRFSPWAGTSFVEGSEVVDAAGTVDKVRRGERRRRGREVRAAANIVGGG